jgi:hypothetical protein
LLSLASAVLLTACLDAEIQTYTYEIELTTDTEPQVTELWYPPEERSSRRALAFAIRLPQNYYLYRDNHHHRNQTTIGLLLEKTSFRPLTEVMRTETGVEEPLSTPRGQEGSLKRLGEARYEDRELLVVINGVEGGLRLRRPEIPQVVAGERQFQADGFDLIAGPSSGAAGSRADLRGYSVSEPLIEVVCRRGVRYCSFYTDYRNSRITFYLPQSEIPDAHRVARGIIDLLDRHLVSSQQQP